jgi:cytochrome c oxidase assembly protein Cox11
MGFLEDFRSLKGYEDSTAKRYMERGRRLEEMAHKVLLGILSLIVAVVMLAFAAVLLYATFH